MRIVLPKDELCATATSWGCYVVEHCWIDDNDTPLGDHVRLLKWFCVAAGSGASEVWLCCC